MSKKRAPPRTPQAAQQNQGGIGVVPAALLVAGIAVLAYLWLTAPEAAEVPAVQPAAQPAANEPLIPVGLDQLSSEHNASLLWGTYRPGTYFGLRSRTAPTGYNASGRPVRQLRSNLAN